MANPHRFESEVLLPEIATPATPATGMVAVYAKSDNDIYRKKDTPGGATEARLLTDDATPITSGLHLTGKVPSIINGYTGMMVVQPPTSDEEVVGAIYKMPDPTWGVGQEYSEGNFQVFLSDSDNDDKVASSNLETITSVTNATPPVVTTSTTHGWETGDIVRITGTGIGAIDNKFWKITVTSTTAFSLQGGTASGASATGYAFSDRSPVLHRLAPDGWGSTGVFHLATGLRGRSGSSLPTSSMWLDPSIDVPALIIDNPQPGEWGPAPTADLLVIRDTRTTLRKVAYVDATGMLALRAREGKVDVDRVFQVRDAADVESAYITATGIITGTRGNFIQSVDAPALVIGNSAAQTVDLVRFTENNGLTVNASISAAGAYQAPPGSAAQPAYTFQADKDTGIYQALADSMSFITGGVQRLAITNTLIFPADGMNIQIGTVTGTKYATASNQKQAWWGATPVIRIAGWGDPTGTLSRTTFATGSVTLTVLAQKVAQLILDLKTYGLLGG